MSELARKVALHPSTFRKVLMGYPTPKGSPFRFQDPVVAQLLVEIEMLSRPLTLPSKTKRRSNG